MVDFGEAMAASMAAASVASVAAAALVDFMVAEGSVAVLAAATGADIAKPGLVECEARAANACRLR